MDKQVQVRMPLEVWEQLQDIANNRAPGTTPALLIRDAIHQVYPIDERRPTNKPSPKGKRGKRRKDD